ncbi:MAG: hypothetical protein U0744_11565 [Gemmataceae bacterium]
MLNAILAGLSPMRFLSIILFALLYADTKAAEPVLVKAWGERGKEAGEFSSPIGLAFNERDELFVSDVNNARVQRFSADGKFLSMFDLPRDTPDRKQCIVGGIAVGGEGLLYIAFMMQHRIGIYSQDGKKVREWGVKGAAAGEFHQPGGILFRKDGTLLVCDQCNHRIQHFTSEGKHLGSFGSHGSKAGMFGGLTSKGSRFGGPHYIAQDAQGNLYTTEGVEGRVQRFAADFAHTLSWGTKGQESGGFGSYRLGKMADTFGPIGIQVDRSNRVWVSSLNDRVQAYSPEGKYLFALDLSKEALGFVHPHAMAVDSKGFFYVADSGNQRILKFEMPK